MSLNWNPVALFVLVVGLTIVTTAGQTTATTTSNKRAETKGVLKRNVLYHYVTDRPAPMPKSNLIQTARNLKSAASVSPLAVGRANFAFPQNYNALLQRLYGKRRSDINLPALEGSMLDYKERQYQDIQNEMAKHLKEYENMDVNKKYASQMQSLSYYPSTKTSIPSQHVDLPPENYLSPMQRQITQPSNSNDGFSQYSQEENEQYSKPEMFQKDGLEEERILEEEKLKELEELRGK